MEPAVPKRTPKPPDLPPPAAALSSQPPVFVGTKGYGSKANYGIAIPPPEIVPSAEQEGSFAVSLSAVVAACSALPTVYSGQDTACPDPIPVTPEEIEEWMSGTFSPVAFSNQQPPEVGDEVLWRGCKVGKKGRQSTAVAYF